MKEMIGAMEKGIEAAQVIAPPLGTYEGINLKVLPKYICFKAALIHNRLTQQYIILFLTALLTSYFIISRVEVSSLYGKLRQKEYILAPGVQDFTPASPDVVSEDYVSSAVTAFLEQLGNTTPGNIDEQYKSLAQNMSPQLKVMFLAEADLQKAKAKAENVSELLTVTTKQIRPSGDGFYQVPVRTRAKTALVCIYPHEMASHDYFLKGWMSLLVEPDQWVLTRPGSTPPAPGVVDVTTKNVPPKKAVNRNVNSKPKIKT